MSMCCYIIHVDITTLLQPTPKASSVSSVNESNPPSTTDSAIQSQAIEIFRQLSSLDPGALPYASLREWTGDFMADAAGDGPHGLLGRGAFGEVFKGLAVSPEGTAAVCLAVKRMDVRKLQLDDAGAGAPKTFIASFRREIHVLSRFRHPNIVRLIGFSEPCPERREPPCLVYELLALGSLSGQLRDDGQAALLPWQTRVDILLQISTAVNYLHCHNPGYPAYHRDIKADNIALSADYTAKLIDCGLSKYIAEDGQGRSILSATGGRFGTPGYMCPSYNDTSTDYDAKSEVYSFGIVLLEVLTGRIQGSSGTDGKKLMLHKSMHSWTPDARAGAWSEKCVQSLLDLGKQCITEYEDRIDSMMAVMQRLRQIKADCYPEESLFQQQIAALVAQNKLLLFERDQAAAAAAQSIRKCLVCYDDELLVTDGFECATNRHFVCKKNGCFEQITKDQSNFKARFATSGCKIVCTFPDCGEVVPDHAVATYAGELGFAAFLRAKIAANEEKVVGDYKERLRALRAEVERDVLAGVNRQATLSRHRNHIIEELLSIKCPNRRCQLVFIMDDNFDECFALKCAGCGSHFCGWCLQDFGRADAHGHTAGCRPQNLLPRGLFPHHENDRRNSAKHCFNQVHGPRRAEAVRAYLDAQNLQGAEREEVIQAVEEQWNTVGVTLLGDHIALR
eukprot:gene33657-43498_t